MCNYYNNYLYSNHNQQTFIEMNDYSSRNNESPLASLEYSHTKYAQRGTYKLSRHETSRMYIIYMYVYNNHCRHCSLDYKIIFVIVNMYTDGI